MTNFKKTIKSLLSNLAQNPLTKPLLLSVARTGLLPQSIWQRLPVQETFSVSLFEGKSFKYSSIANDGIGRHLFWRGIKSYEPETIKLFYRLVQKAHLFLDVGANTGLFTLVALAANENSQVISFEPVPNVYKLLVSNVKINGWTERVQERNEAVSNTLGSTKLHIPSEDVPKSASLNIQGFRGMEGALVDVPVTTIDAVCTSNKKVDLIKIDVEGLEDKVLQGMERVLSESKPTLIIECNPDDPFLNVESILSKFGYHFFHVRAEGPVPMDRIVPDETGQYRNYLCTVHHNWEEIN
ncbi:FkbM family methyltransferase [Calothrix sp. NIES-2098]|uniref:FkbM family methyltransferase n=1 Tax=Calothrix sp. NIES-2098 TaxID=1954171 RepID=UPI000B61ADDD|nr:FkbM family methyltransferase [Calothrix sp. NIES-2098]